MVEKKVDPKPMNVGRLCPFKDAKAEYNECPALHGFLAACKEVHTAAKVFNDESFIRRLNASKRRRQPKKGSKLK